MYDIDVKNAINSEYGFLFCTYSVNSLSFKAMSGPSIAKIGNHVMRYRSIIFTEVANIYRPALRRQKEELIELIKEKYSKSLRSGFADKIRTAKSYYRLEMSPPGIDEMKKLQEDLGLVKNFIFNNCYKQITVKQAWLLFLVGLEIGLWFFLGETIGKFHIVGYQV